MAKMTTKDGDFLKDVGKKERLKNPDEVLDAIDKVFKDRTGYVTMEHICRELDISVRTLRRWMHDDKDYDKLRQLINDLNSDRVDEKALTGEYNAQYSIFIQKAKMNKIERERKERLEIERNSSLQPKQIQVNGDIFDMLKDKDIDSYGK